MRKPENYLFKRVLKKHVSYKKTENFSITKLYDLIGLLCKNVEN